MLAYPSLGVWLEPHGLGDPEPHQAVSLLLGELYLLAKAERSAARDEEHRALLLQGRSSLSGGKEAVAGHRSGG